LVKRLPQSRFEMVPFDTGRFNLHQHQSQGEKSPTLVVLVHGLFGQGYKTWGTLPQRLFDGAEGPALDVGVYDYRNGIRGIMRRAGKWEFWRSQLVSHLQEIESEYTDVVLIGHSMGGLLIEAVTKTYIERRALEHLNDAGKIAALVVLSAPRAGSGWALPVLPIIMSETRVLRRLAPHLAEVDEFFATYVERHNVATPSDGQIVLPVYAAIGGRDRLVSQFSAMFSVPTGQRLHLDATHISIVKPEADDAQLASWLQRTIAERLEVRAQAMRLDQHADRGSTQAVADPRYTLITRFISDSSGLHWEELYNEARHQATTTTVTVQDIREISSSNVDVNLIVAIHDAALVVAADPGVRTAVLDAHAEQERQSSMSVGVCPVGANFLEAEVTVREWIVGRPLTPSFYIKGTADAEGLRGVLARLIQLLIGRDPHRAARAALAEQEFEALNDGYGSSEGGGF
jgi:pimeloyl-ACP methyl ester carboxylesterase